MSNRRKKGRREPKDRSSEVSHSPWRKLAKALLALPVIGAIGLYAGFISSGADQLRADVYGPLHSEISTLEQAVLNCNQTSPYSSEIIQKLKTTGDWYRIPAPLRTKIELAYSQSGNVVGHVLPLTHRLEIIVPIHVSRLRTAKEDEQWRIDALGKLNSQQERGLTPYAQATLSHTGTTPSLDVRSGKIGSPGSVTWLINDWNEYPESLRVVEKDWTDEEFLNFHEKLEQWQVRITKDDLKNHGLTLQQFVQPMYDQLAKDSDFIALKTDRAAALGTIQETKTELEKRMDQPKRLVDLIR